jgi:hypothetical protein
MAALDFPSSPSVGQTYSANGRTWQWDGQSWVGAQIVPFGDPNICNGRLSLESGVPISTTDQTGKTTIYWVPYRGNRMSIYNGSSAWVTLSSAQISVALGTLTSGKNYDVFAYNNSGTLALEIGPAWTNDTTRATALTTQDGVYVKSGDTTRRYLGTFRTTSTTTTEDSGGGSTSQVGGKRFLWNYYNRVARRMSVFDTTAQWSYTTTTIRQANGAAGNKVEFVQGVSEDVVSGTLSATVEMETTTSPPSIGIGLDTTTAYSSNLRVTTYNSTSTYITMPVSIPFSLIIAEGYHYLAWLEKGASATTCKFGGKEDSADQNAFSVVFLG